MVMDVDSVETLAGQEGVEGHVDGTGTQASMRYQLLTHAIARNSGIHVVPVTDARNCQAAFWLVRRSVRLLLRVRHR